MASCLLTLYVVYQEGQVMTPTPDPIKTIEELVTSVYHEAYKCGVGARHPHAYRSVEAVTKEATQAINNELLRAKQEQIMQDELSLQDFDIDENQLIQWRLDRLAQLKQSQTERGE